MKQDEAARPCGSECNDQLGRVVDHLLAYSDIRRSDQRESREALRELLLGALRDAVAASVAAERERCAKLCETRAEWEDLNPAAALREVAAEIRWPNVAIKVRRQALP